MAWRTDKTSTGTDIVIDGWENGIADDPYEGLGDVRNINLLSTPKEAPVGFATGAVTLPPIYNTTAFTAAASTDILTTATTSGFYTGMAVIINSFTIPSSPLSYLVVGGGGAGGYSHVSGSIGGGGGGAGGMLTGTSTVSSGTPYTITVGAGGTGVGSGVGNSGASSVAFGTTASGGGGGGGGTSSSVNGANGASGGGANVAGTGGTGTVGQGHDGGNGSSGINIAGGGGGGATSAGSNGVTTAGGAGGNGTASSISGASVTYAGGGGGQGSGGGAGGSGGGGAKGVAGTDGLGGGGGAGDYGNAGAAGGKGIVIISVATGLINVGATTGGTHTSAGGNDIWTFTTSGTWTPIVVGFSPVAGSNTYYVGNITATTFKLYKDLHVTTLLDVVADGSGTFSTAQLATPFDSCNGINTSGLFTSGGQVIQENFILDSSGQVWLIGNGSDGYALNTLQFCGNTSRTTLTTSGSLGIVVFKNYLFVFIENKIDYIYLSNLFDSSGPNGDWVIAWQTTTASLQGHKAISATDDAMYFCNASAVGSVLQNSGTTFDPSNSTTYTYNATALALPTFDFSTCLAQLGTYLLVGGVLQYIYPWDRTSTSFVYPLIVAETFTKRIVSTNASAYIFAGNRGRIYLTNGANISLFKKFPDQLSGTENPFYTWGDATYLKNQLYFSVSATTNGGVAISNFAGVWAISLESQAHSSVAYGSSAGPLSLANSLSYGTYAGTVPVLLPMGNVNPLGNALYSGWLNSTGGIDYSSGSPYTNYEPYIDSDMIPVGTYFNPETNAQIEYKLAKPLVTGESIRIAWRGNLTDSFTTVQTFTTVGLVADATSVNFEKQQWVQLRISMSSTASTPSYNRLREIRMR